tara:strand:- start:2054 stop:2623 length:570 start_codon:yes stop_codon:yes gene_type:complete
MQYIPNELALVRATAHQADELVDLLGDENSDQSQLLNQLQSILETQEAGVDLLIELRRRLVSNSEFYKERAKAIKEYAQSMDRAKDFVDESIISLSNELGNRLEGSAEALCIQNNPAKVEYIGDNTDEDLILLHQQCPELVNREYVYSINKQFAKDNPNHPVVKQWFTFTQGKHIRVRRSTTPKSLPKG